MPIRIKPDQEDRKHLFAEPREFCVLKTEKDSKTIAIVLNLGEMALVVHGDAKRFQIQDGMPSQGTAVLVQAHGEYDADDELVYQEFVRVAKTFDPNGELPSLDDLVEWNLCVPAGIEYTVSTDSEGKQWVEVKNCQYFTDPCVVDDDGVMHPIQ